MSLTTGYCCLLLIQIVFGTCNWFCFRVASLFFMVSIVLRLDEIISLMKGVA